LKILIVKLSSLGDVVHAMPAVQDLAQAFPHAQIDWVVERGFAPLVRRCKGVHRVIPCELRRWRKNMFYAETRKAWQLFKDDLRQDEYDAVIDLQGLTKSALVSWMARLSHFGKRYAMANQTAGSSYEAPTRWVAHTAIALPQHSHAVSRSRDLCALAFGYSLPTVVSYGLVAQMDKALEAIKYVALKTGSRGVVALVHGTSRTDKKWPLAHWRELATRLNTSGFGVVVLHGSDAEEQVSHEMVQGHRHAQIWPRMALDALTDSLAHCVGVVGVDSGLSHIGVALNLAHVQIYNFDTAWRTGPLAPAEPVLQAPMPPLVPGVPTVSMLRQQMAETAATSTVRQVAVFAQPTPSVDQVWQAWERVSVGLVSR